MRITCVDLCSSCLQIFNNFSRNCCFLLDITCTRRHSIIERTQTSLRGEINSPTNQGTSEGPKISAPEGSTRRIRICHLYFCTGVILKDILKKRQNGWHTNRQSRFGDSSPAAFCALSQICCTWPFRFWGNWFSCVYTWNAIQLYGYSGSKLDVWFIAQLLSQGSLFPIIHAWLHIACW